MKIRAIGGMTVFINLMRTLKKQGKRMLTGFIWLRDQWQALVNTIMTLQVP
jgi:hypothetical protein